MGYIFTYNDKSFELDGSNCSFFMNDEEKPVQGTDLLGILDEMTKSDRVDFQKEYYDQACEGCHKNRQEGGKYFEFLEFHFYLFSKGQEFVMSNLSADYGKKVLPDLLNEGIVDGSYIVSINVCENCGDYTVDLEYGLW